MPRSAATRVASQRPLPRAVRRSLGPAVLVLAVLPLHSATAALEEVVVTARKRVETLQDVPISITTMGEEQLQRLGAVSLKDIRHVVPSMHYQDRGALQTELTIRGVGGDARNIGIESGVGMYVDGVYAGRTSSYNIDLADIQQIEVLRGPQGTLFGKNTTGGALNIITEKPSDAFIAKGQASYGNYNALRLKGSLNGALTDSLFGKVVLASWDRDGYLDNLYDGSELQGEDRKSARLQLRYLATDRLEFNFSADFTHDDQKAILNQLGSDAGFGAPFYNRDRFKVNTDQRNSIERDMYGLSLTADYAFDSGFQFTSITAFRDTDITVHSDIDQTPVDIFRSGPFTDDGEQLSQEFRLASPGGERIDYVAGLYFYWQDAAASRQIFASGTPLFFTDGPVDTTAYAAFANVNFNLSEAFTLTTGLRFTDEEKEGEYSQYSEVSPAFIKDIPDLETSSNEMSWTVSGNYKWSEEVSTYLSASRGFKSGGFNVDPLATPAPLTADDITFDPEFVTTYELGFKADLFDNLARVSGAVFYSDYEDRQVSQFETVGGIPTVITRNAGESEIEGAEFEFNFAPSDKWLLYGSVSYLDGKYTSFPGATTGGADYTGNTTEKTPRWSVNLGGEYRHPVAGGELSIAPQYSYAGLTYLQPDNGAFNVEAGYGLVNLRIGYRTLNDRYAVYLWGKNLSDSDYKEFTRQFQGSDQVLWGEPRTYGVEFVFNID